VSANSRTGESTAQRLEPPVGQVMLIARLSLTRVSTSRTFFWDNEQADTRETASRMTISLRKSLTGAYPSVESAAGSSL